VDHRNMFWLLQSHSMIVVDGHRRHIGPLRNRLSVAESFEFPVSPGFLQLIQKMI
jgi:hypothetical protein